MLIRDTFVLKLVCVCTPCFIKKRPGTVRGWKKIEGWSTFAEVMGN